MYSINKKRNNVLYNDSIENVKISLLEKNLLDFIEIEEPKKLKFPKDYRNSMDNTIKSDKLKNLAKGSKKVVIIVSDATRGIPTGKVLPFVIDDLIDAGIDLKQITIIIALGVHRPATKSEMKEIVGEKYFEKIKIINHNGFDKKNLVYLGETSLGTPIEVNKTVYEADFKIIIGKVEPHEFAGFSGGRKSILPGVSSEKTIESNHRPEMLLNENARPGVMLNNPVNEDMAEAAEVLGVDFAINIVQNIKADVVGIFSGDIFESHLKAVEYMRSVYSVGLKERPDIIVTTPGRPLNIDFYQSIKPIIALAPIIKKNGVIVMYSECREGVNSVDMLKPYEESSTVEDVVEYLMSNYKIQMDHALLLSKIMQKKIKIVVYSPNIDKSVLKKMFIETADNPQDALEKAYKLTEEKEPKVLFFPQPQRTLPKLGK